MPKPERKKYGDIVLFFNRQYMIVQATPDPDMYLAIEIWKRGDIQVFSHDKPHTVYLIKA